MIPFFIVNKLNRFFCFCINYRNCYLAVNIVCNVLCVFIFELHMSANNCYYYYLNFIAYRTAKFIVVFFSEKITCGYHCYYNNNKDNNDNKYYRYYYHHHHKCKGHI